MASIIFKIKKAIPLKIFQTLQPAYHFCLSFLGNLVYRQPSKRLIVIGVTGTTGKTSSVVLIAKTLISAGYRVGYTSTALFNDGQTEWLNDKKMTMIGGFFTQRLLRRLVKNKCQYAIVETTSEGIRQFRHRFINYDLLVFTGLYPEHLESHGNFENYKAAKGELFAHLKRCSTKYVNDQKYVARPKTEFQKLNWQRVKKTIIANYDDEHVEYFLNFWAEQKIGYTVEIYPGHDIEVDSNKLPTEDLELIKAANIKISPWGTTYDIIDSNGGGIQINLKLLGDFNAINSLTAVAVGLNQGLTLDQIKRGLEQIKGLVGRLELINVGQKFPVIVDYAYEPLAVTKLYETINLLPHERIIHVLGSAGGGRDKARRPILGEIAVKRADVIIITNEDPYDEDPQMIIDEVARGAFSSGKRLNENLFKILDRRIAIKKALTLAKENDIVIITGKGSEQAICGPQGLKTPWDDRMVVREELQRLVVDQE